MPTSKPDTRLVLADDHPMVLAGLVASLSAQSGFVIAGQGRDGNEALRLARDCRPDVMMMDIKMPGLSGLQVTEQLRREMPEIKVLILSVHDEKEYILRALRVGAQGYLLKSAATEEVVRAIQTVLLGQIYYSPELTPLILKDYVNHADDPNLIKSSGLSHREIEVMKLVADGFSTKEIAEKLNLSDKTVGKHRENIMVKLDLRNAADVTKYAISKGYVTL